MAERLPCMKTKKVIGILLLVFAAVLFGYWLGYQHGSRSALRGLTAATSPRQIGLAFRGDRNDMTRFTTTGVVAAPQSPTQQP